MTFKKDMILYIAVFLTILLVYCLVPFNCKYGYLTYIFYIIPLFFVTTQSYKAAKIYGKHNYHYKSLYTIFIGLCLVAIGEAAIAIQQGFLHIDAFPTIADVFIIIGYPTILVGIIKEMINIRIKFIPKNIYIPLVGIFLVFYFFIMRYYYNPGMNLIWNVVFLLYRTVDLLMVIYTILVVRISFEFIKGKLFYAWLYIAIGALCAISAGIFVSIYYDQYKLGLFPYTLIDMFWIGGYLISAYGFLQIRKSIIDIQESIKKINTF